MKKKKNLDSGIVMLALLMKQTDSKFSQAAAKLASFILPRIDY